jgi:signal transduction histidine kinase
MKNPFSFAEDDILIEQLRLVISNFRSTLPVIVVPFLLFWALQNNGNMQSLAVWCAAVISAHLLLQIYTRIQFSKNIHHTQTHKIILILAMLNFVDGGLWGLLSWIVLDAGTQADFILVCAVFAGMMGGGLATQSPIPLLFISFTLPHALLLSTKLLTHHEPAFFAIGIGSLIFLITIFGQVLNSARITHAGIKYRIDLACSHEKLRKIEKKRTLEQERQRLMQDMHDGLGSSLISALREVERGKMNDKELATVIKGCIDDLKLAIDSMEPVDKNLLLLLATLRFRLEPRLENAGIKLQWCVENVPILEWLDPKSALHILRILQEAIANVIKHTNATEVTISTSLEEGLVSVKITDNGSGFDIAEAFASNGRGIFGQKYRATAIGAEITWISNNKGTCITLNLPINR